MQMKQARFIRNEIWLVTGRHAGASGRSDGQFPLDRLGGDSSRRCTVGSHYDARRSDLMWHAYQLISPSGPGIVCVCHILAAGLGNPHIDYNKIQEWKTDCNSWSVHSGGRIYSNFQLNFVWGSVQRCYSRLQFSQQPIIIGLIETFAMRKYVLIALALMVSGQLVTTSYSKSPH